MDQFLKNYTSATPAVRSIQRIEELLIRCGVSGIAKLYGDGGVMTAITFTVQMPNGNSLQVKLPADREAVHQALWLDYAGKDRLTPDGQRLAWGGRKQKARKDFADQADRTAWSLMRDWVEVQLSLIMLQKTDAVQVFLPYVWDGKQTFYERLRGDNYQLLLGPKTA